MVRDAIQMFRGGMLSLMQFATVQVRASAGYPEPVQVISECGASYKLAYYINYLIMRPGPRGMNHALPGECAVDGLV